MAQAKAGDTVKVHYTGTLDNGSQFDTSRGREPLEFTIGEQRVIPGFEAAVSGMSEGDTVTTRVPPEQAYGERRDDLVLEVDRGQFPDDMSPEVGMRLAIQQQDGQPIPVTIAEVKDESVILDANHQLAGETLTFEIELVSIE